jgi:flagellar basal body-associated protein FliL
LADDAPAEEAPAEEAPAAETPAAETPAAETPAADAEKSSGTVFIVIGVLVVVAVAIAGVIYVKRRGNKNESEGGEADDRKLYKSQIASVNAHKKAQKVALVDADV